MTNEFGALIDLFDNLIHDAQGEMYHAINFNPKDLRVSCPEFITELFVTALSLHTHQQRLGKDFVYKGLTFVPCYELEIAVWHKDYPLYKKAWMIRKLPLQTPYVVHNGMYDKYIFMCKPLLNRFVSENTHKMN